MLNVKVQSSCDPARVVIENLPEGRCVIRLTDHVTERTEEESTVYEYDEVVFDLPEDRSETVASINDAFAAWWEYGQQEQEAITLEQRVSDLEELVLVLMEG